MSANERELNVDLVTSVKGLSAWERFLAVAKQIEQNTARTASGVSNLENRVQGLGTRFQATNRQADGFITRMQTAAHGAEHLSNRLRGIGTSGLILGGILTASVTAPIVGLGVEAVQAATDLDSLKRGLLTTEGSADKVAQRLKALEEVAKLPGLGFREAIQGQVQLATALRDQVPDAANVSTKTLRAFGNAIATTGGGKAELERVILQLSQMAAVGRVLSADLRPIISTAPAVGAALRDAFGTTSPEAINKLKLSTDEFLSRLIASLNKLPQVTGGIRNSFENLDDALFRTKAAIGEVIIPELAVFLDNVAEKAEQFAKFFKELPPFVQKAAIVMAALVAAIGPLVVFISTIIIGIAALVASIAFLIENALVLGVAIAVIAGAFIQLMPVVVALGVAIAAFAHLWNSNLDNIREKTFAAFGAVKAFIKDTFVQIKAQFQQILPLLLEAQANFLQAVRKFWLEHGDQIIAIIKATWNFITNFIKTAILLISQTIQLVLNLINGHWDEAWTNFENIVAVAVTAVRKLIDKLEFYFLVGLAKILVAVSNAADRMKTAFLALIIKGIDAFTHYLGTEGHARIALALFQLAQSLSSPSQLIIWAAIGAARAQAVADGFEKRQADLAQGILDEEARKEHANAQVGGGDLDTTKKPPAKKIEAPDKAAAREAKAELESARELADAKAELALKVTIEMLDKQLFLNEQLYARDQISFRKYITDKHTFESGKIDNEIEEEKRKRKELQDQLDKGGLKGSEQLKIQTQQVDIDKRIADLRAQQNKLTHETNADLEKSDVERILHARELNAQYLELTGHIKEASDIEIDLQFRDELQKLSVAIKETKETLKGAKEIGNTDLADTLSSTVQSLEATKAIVENHKLLLKSKGAIAQVQNDINIAEDVFRATSDEIARQVEFEGEAEQEALDARLEAENKLKDVLQTALDTMKAQAALSPDIAKGLIASIAELETRIKSLGKIPLAEQFNTAQKSFDRLNDKRKNDIQEILNLERLISPEQITHEEAIKRINRVNEKYKEDVKKILVILRQIAEASKNEDLINFVDRLNNEVDESTEHVDEFDDEFKKTAANALSSGLVNMFTDIASGAKSAKDAALDFVRSFLAAIEQLIIKLLVTKALIAIFNAIEPGSGTALFGGGERDGGPVGFARGGMPIRVSNGEGYIPARIAQRFGVARLNAMNTGRLPILAPFAKIRGAGTGTSDSIPMIAEVGSYILKARTVDEYMNQITPSNRSSYRFAVGGNVQQGSLRDNQQTTPQPNGDVLVKIVNVNDTKQAVRDVLAEPDSADLIINQIGSKPQKTRNALELKQ